MMTNNFKGGKKKTCNLIMSFKFDLNIFVRWVKEVEITLVIEDCSPIL